MKSAKEGDPVFANEPILQIEGPLAQCQLVETAILNIVNYQTLIATKARRIKTVIEDEPLLEFGSRRAQEMDAAIWGLEQPLSAALVQLPMSERVRSLGFLYQGLTRILWCRPLAMTMMPSKPTLQLTKIVFS